MATPFLQAFSEAVLAALSEQDLIEVEPGGQPAVAGFVAHRLADAAEGESLISTLAAALIAAPGVGELYVDDEQLKELVTDLPYAALPRGPR